MQILVLTRFTERFVFPLAIRNRTGVRSSARYLFSKNRNMVNLHTEVIAQQKGMHEESVLQT